MLDDILELFGRKRRDGRHDESDRSYDSRSYGGGTQTATRPYDDDDDDWNDRRYSRRERQRDSFFDD